MRAWSANGSSASGRRRAQHEAPILNRGGLTASGAGLQPVAHYYYYYDYYYYYYYYYYYHYCTMNISLMRDIPPTRATHNG